MILQDTKIGIESNLHQHIDQLSPHHSIKEAYDYSLFPVGKLFRPLLVSAIYFDIGLPENKPFLADIKSPHALLCSAIECHHAYTLVHDDLPSMDDDSMRRGKPTVHKKFGEWKAILVGDGLLNTSYALLSRISHEKLSEVLRFFSWCVGSRGLIQGQVLDMSKEINDNFEILCNTHVLKTARLMQCSLVSSYLLIDMKKATSRSDYRVVRDLFKLGEALGLIFQFMDDLSELTSENISIREGQINPWICFYNQTLNEMSLKIQRVEKIISLYQLFNVRDVLMYFLDSIIKIVEQKITTIEHHLRKEDLKDLLPAMLLFKRICQIH